MSKLPVTVIILTFNEEDNLPAALDSVTGWAKEVFVVDSYSTDRTVDIAMERRNDGVRVVQHRFEDYSRQWNWALEHLPITAAWTLKLDADERVTPPFKSETGRLLATAPGNLEGVYFRRLVFFMGKPLRWGGMLQNHDLRMWRTGCARFEDRPANEHAVVQGNTIRFDSRIEHFTSKTLSDWLEKHNRYSSLEATSIIGGDLTGEIPPKLFGSPEQRRMWFKRLYSRLPLRHVAYFAYRYIARLGFLDGRAGFRFAFLHAAFMYWVDLKVREYQEQGKMPEILWPARGRPHPLLAGPHRQLAAESPSSETSVQERL